MQSWKQRLKSLIDSENREIPLMLQNSINLFFLPELREAKQSNLDQLVFLGTHSIIQTISGKIFSKKGKKGTKFYLENFVDESASDKKFSLISDYIHSMRNVIAHQWFSIQRHDIEINPKMEFGWKFSNPVLRINPIIYADQFIAGFKSGKIYRKYCQLLTEKEKVICKYNFIRDWLGLGKSHPISLEIKKLRSFAGINQIKAQEKLIKKMMYKEFNI